MGDYDRRHVVIQWGGSLPGGEIWTNMMRAGGSQTGESSPVFPTHEDLAAWCAGHIKDALKTWHQSVGAYIGAGCKLEWVKVNAVGMNGRYLDPNTIEYFYPAPLGGAGQATDQHPNQIALAISLTTGLSRGPAHRGRFYMPMPVAKPDPTTGLIPTGTAQAAATAAAEMIVAVADTPGIDATTTPFRVLVMSRKTGAPATNVVTGVEVGRVLDTQRRRRVALGEDYQSAVVDQGPA